MQKKIRILSLLVGAVLLLASAGWAQDFYVIGGGGPPVGTKITSLPYPINSPGFYFLGRDLNTSGNGITVNTDNVTIDLMGFGLAGNGTAGMHGIEISGRSNVEIRNGTVRNFGGGGIYSVMNSQNCRIINIRAIMNGGPGIKLVGSNHLVQNCTASNNSSTGIWQSGSGTMITGNVCNMNGSNGIECASGGNLIGNVVYGNGAYGFNLSLATSDYYVIDRNTVYQNTSGGFNGKPTKAEFGINAGIP
jgi:hypothetical protein